MDINMETIDTREWKVTIARTICPFIFNPSNYVGCHVRQHEGEEDDRCTLENCPRREAGVRK